MGFNGKVCGLVMAFWFVLHFLFFFFFSVLNFLSVWVLVCELGELRGSG